MQIARFIESALDILFPLADTARAVRECTEETFLELISPTVAADGTVTLLPYRHRMVRAVILQAKFHRNAKAIAFLARTLEEYLAAEMEDAAAWGEDRTVIVPMPLGTGRKQERGFNQVEEMTKTLPGVNTHVLVRTRETVPQTSLSRRERLTNMAGAFATRGSIERQHTYIVIDDVLTTGATLAAAKAALQAGGAANVRSLAFAH